MRWLVVLVIASCAVDAPALDARHPANPAAEHGRLAGAPPTLRPGVVEYKDVPALRTGDAPVHHHHGS